MKSLHDKPFGTLALKFAAAIVSASLLFACLPTSAGTKAAAADTTAAAETSLTLQSLQIPAYSGSPFTPVNGNVPFFTAADLSTTSYEYYSDLDALGRCGAASACIGVDLMPTEPRGEIGPIKPTGWHTVKYNGIDGNYLYNRCHLIGYQLTGENANEKNLITGTRYLNVEGMEPFENLVADYIKSTGNHVLYRVTPIFTGNNLLADGVLMEGESVEDQGAGILYCVFCYNVQPGITIQYSDGSSAGPEFTGSQQTASSSAAQTSAAAGAGTAAAAASTQTQTASVDMSEAVYIGNKNTKKFHYPSCSSVSDMKDKNKVALSSRDEAIAEGYVPCKRCNP